MFVKQARVYLVPSTAVHTIREALQIILDYGEIQKSQVVITQVHRIMDELCTTELPGPPAQ